MFLEKDKPPFRITDILSFAEPNITERGGAVTRRSEAVIRPDRTEREHKSIVAKTTILAI